MAGRIQGITVEIGGDTTKLQTALKGVNTEIRNTQSQLRDVDKFLKLDPGNTELLVQKHRLLRDAVKETKEKLETLKTAAEQAEQALKDGTITQDQYDGLQREIAETEAKLRYDGLKGCTDYKKAVQIIKDGGYATSLTYVEKLISIIEKWKLTDYDAKDSGGEVIRWYRVRKSWADAKTQKGAYKILDNAKKCADQNQGYKVFDADGKVVYEPKAAEPAVKVPFLVKVSISDLNIRKGPGTDYGRVRLIEPGVFTIVEVRSGKGSSAGWGRLKSGIGWISLDFVRRI